VADVKELQLSSRAAVSLREAVYHAERRRDPLQTASLEKLQSFPKEEVL
jgi:hypothetical protein